MSKENNVKNIKPEVHQTDSSEEASEQRATDNESSMHHSEEQKQREEHLNNREEKLKEFETRLENLADFISVKQKTLDSTTEEVTKQANIVA